MWWRFFKQNDELNLPHLCFHCTRVTFVTRAQSRAFPQSKMMKLVNHASDEIHRVYQRLVVADVRAELNAIRIPSAPVAPSEDAQARPASEMRGARKPQLNQRRPGRVVKSHIAGGVSCHTPPLVLRASDVAGLTAEFKTIRIPSAPATPSGDTPIHVPHPKCGVRVNPVRNLLRIKPPRQRSQFGVHGLFDRQNVADRIAQLAGDLPGGAMLAVLVWMRRFLSEGGPVVGSGKRTGLGFDGGNPRNRPRERTRGYRGI